MNKKELEKLAKLEKSINYTFADKEILKVAMTHSSHSNESKKDISNNERLEFLGDSILSLVISDFLFRNFSVPEGELTKLRASLVCEQSLYIFASKISLSDYIFLGYGESQSGGAKRPSILADAFEALIAAIYLDSGIDDSRRFIIPFVEDMMETGTDQGFQDYKTLLQEIIQKNPEESIYYKLVDESGPDHDKSFVVEIFLNSNVIGKGTGRSKKNAEQEAARQALELMGK